MPSRFLSKSQSQFIQTIAESDTNDIFRKRAQILLQLNQGATPDQLTHQYNLDAEEIEFLYQSFLNQGEEVLSSAGEGSKPSQNRTSTIRETDEISSDSQTPGILVKDTMPEAGRKILGFHLARMLSNEPGTRLGHDPMALHDMRVASRRMRVALDLFEPFFDAEPTLSLQKGLRNTTKALGRARDLDVLLEKFINYLGTVPDSDHPSYQSFLDYYEETRANARMKMISFLDSDEYEEFKEIFAQFLDASETRTAEAETTKPNQVRTVAPKLILDEFAAVRAYEKIVELASMKELHTLRLQLKKFRYTVEFFQEVLHPESEVIIQRTIELQDHLGNLNDADVACGIISMYLHKIEKIQYQSITAPPENLEPIYTYLSQKNNERRELAHSFPGVWISTLNSNFSEMLKGAISIQ